MDYSAKVKELRENLLLTQEEFAKELGVSYVTVCRWENKKSEPSIKAKREIVALCKKRKVCMEERI